MKIRKLSFNDFDCTSPAKYDQMNVHFRFDRNNTNIISVYTTPAYT